MPDVHQPHAKRVPEVNSSCRLLIVPLFRGSSRFAILILSHHSSKVTCECNEEDIDDDDDKCQKSTTPRVLAKGPLAFKV